MLSIDVFTFKYNTVYFLLYFFIASGAVRRRTTGTDITCVLWDLAYPTCGWIQDPNDDFDWFRYASFRIR